MACLVFRLCDNAPEILRDVCLDLGWKEYDEDDEENDWNLWWKTSGFRTSDFEACRPWQRLNHFPKSIAITRKDCLARNLRRMKGIYGNSIYNFVPLSFNLPNDYRKFVTEYTKHKEAGKTVPWICKPADQSRGKGIFIFKDLSELTYDCATIVQKYIPNPLLIAGYKFDLRIYVLVTSFRPLHIYVYHEGLVRFGTEKFDLNYLKNVYSHLTNTSINKQSPCYATDKDRIGRGCKWSIGQLRTYFHQNDIDDRLLWHKINAIIILTLLAQAPEVQENCTNSFELFGFDVLVDTNLKPWLLEVNFSPSLGVDCALDRVIKKPLLQDTLEIVNLKESDIATYSSCIMNAHDKKTISKPRPNSQMALSQAARQNTAGRSRNRSVQGCMSRSSVLHSRFEYRKLIASNSESYLPVGKNSRSTYDRQLTTDSHHDGKGDDDAKDDDGNDHDSSARLHKDENGISQMTCHEITRQSMQSGTTSDKIPELSTKRSSLVSNASIEFHTALNDDAKNVSSPAGIEDRACNLNRNSSEYPSTFEHPESSIDGEEEESEETCFSDCSGHRKGSSGLPQQRCPSSMKKVFGKSNHTSSKRSSQSTNTRRQSLMNWKDKYASSFNYKAFSKMKLCKRVGDYVLIFPFNDACEKCCSSKQINSKSAIDEVKKAIHRISESIKAESPKTSPCEDEKPLDLNKPYWGFSSLFDYSVGVRV